MASDDSSDVLYYDLDSFIGVVSEPAIAKLTVLTLFMLCSFVNNILRNEFLRQQ